jgi:hypothetical protein
MNKRDRAALELAMAKAREEPGRSEQLDAKLMDEPWEEVAQFAAGCVQSRALRLAPWERPPCETFLDEDDPERAPAVQLLTRMLKAGVSRFHPSPIEACEAAETATSAS